MIPTIGEFTIENMYPEIAFCDKDYVYFELDESCGIGWYLSLMNMKVTSRDRDIEYDNRTGYLLIKGVDVI